VGALELMLMYLMTFGGVLPPATDWGGMVELTAASPSPGVTPEAYARVEAGMSYDDVVALFDAPGISVGRIETSENRLEWYGWKGRDDFKVLITFDDGRVYSKNDVTPTSEEGRSPSDAGGELEPAPAK
jgi:hypothetical protein